MTVAIIHFSKAHHLAATCSVKGDDAFENIFGFTAITARIHAKRAANCARHTRIKF